MSRRRFVHVVWVTVLLPLLLLLGAVPAQAHDVSEHDGSKGVATDLRSTVVGSDLPAGVEVSVRANGESLYLRNDSATPATVLRSDGSDRVTVPAGGSARWHEDAAHPDSAAVGEDDPVATWRLAVRIGTETHRVDGEIRWREGPSPVGWILLAVGVAAVVGGVAWRTRRDLVAVAIPLAGAVAASMLHTVAAFAAREPADGRSDALGDYLPVAGCWLLGILATVLLLRGNRDGTWLAGLAVAGLALVTFSGDAAVLWSSTLVVDLPDGLDRVVVSVLLGSAAGALIAVPRALRRPRTGVAGTSDGRQ